VGDGSDSVFAVVSDIHGNLEALEAALADIERRSIKEIYCLGDIVGYGASPKECLDAVIERCKLSLCGNHDQAVFYEPTNFNVGAERAAYWTRQVLEDESAPAGPKVLGQVSAEGPKPLFCLCFAEETNYADVDLSVALKGVKGKIDQGGGPVWRLQDENNYYVARMNPLESNFRLYKVIDGKRSQLASADVDVPDEDLDADDPLLNKWHTIRVVHGGDQIQCYLNGELRLESQDSSIPNAGKIGLWVKADAVTSFDKLSVTAPSE